MDFLEKSKKMTVARDLRAYIKNSHELYKWLGNTPFTYFHAVVFYKDNGKQFRHDELFIIDGNEPDFADKIREHAQEIECARYGNDFIAMNVTEVNDGIFDALYTFGKMQAVIYDLRADGTAKATVVAFGQGAFDY